MAPLGSDISVFAVCCLRYCRISWLRTRSGRLVGRGVCPPRRLRSAPARRRFWRAGSPWSRSRLRWSPVTGHRSAHASPR